MQHIPIYEFQLEITDGHETGLSLLFGLIFAEISSLYLNEAHGMSKYHKLGANGALKFHVGLSYTNPLEATG